MKDSSIMVKKSIAKRLTVRLAILLISVMLVLMVGSFLMVLNIIGEEAFKYNSSIAYTICDLVIDNCQKANRPVDVDSSGDIKLYSDYFCDWTRVDFIYAFKVWDNETKLEYLGFSGKEKDEEIEKTFNELLYREIDFEPTEKEEEILRNGGDGFYFNEYSHFGDSTQAVAVSEDGFGNRFVVGVGISYEELFKLAVSRFAVLFVILIGVFIVMMIIMYYVIRRRVFLPAKRISDSMADFIKNGQRTNIKVDESGTDEFAMIASSFNKMTTDIDQYLENIRQLYDAQSRQQTELDIAARIQRGFLAPSEYHGKECEIFTMMVPARNVGGDLYDYFALDDGRILMTIADVSGKGIAASMFMAITLVLIRQLASSGLGPAKIFSRINNIISDNNKYMLFTTAFIGIYDPATGELTYSNAGHLPPYILRNKPELLTGARNLVFGLYKDEPYIEEKTKLDTGDILFLYTDGVTEAIDNNKTFFNDERLKSVLDSFRASHEENIVEYVTGELENFMKDSEQFDDITMLACTAKHRTELNLSPNEKEFARIKEVILNSKLPRQLQLSLCVAAEEIYINICSYAFEGRSDDDKNIKFIFEHSDRVMMRFEDNGIEYDPTREVELDIDYDPDNRLGGLGKLIAFNIADKVGYEYTDNKNILTITKYLMEG